MRLTGELRTADVRAGRLTSVLRAARTEGDRCLRVGVVRDGRILDEALVRGPSVTVGRNERSRWIVQAVQLPESFRLFERSSGGWSLCFTETMVGRLAVDGAITDLEDLRQRLPSSRSGIRRVPLDEHARGKVVVGNTTFLFQMVSLPRATPRPQLPAGVLRTSDDVDWPTAIVAACSFLLHFLVLGAFYSDWLDPVVDDDVTVSGVVDRLGPVAPAPLEVPSEGPATESEPAPESEPDRASAGSPERSAVAGGSAAGPSLVDELESIRIGLVSALVEGEATTRVLGAEVPTGALDDIARRRTGVSGARGLDLTTTGGPVTGSGSGSLVGIGDQRKSSSAVGDKQPTDGPKPGTTVATAGVTGIVTNAESVIAGLRGAFRVCYMRELRERPDAQGTVSLVFQVGPGGAVPSVTASGSGSLGSTIGCVQARARQAAFAAPEGGSAAVHASVRFYPAP